MLGHLPLERISEGFLAGGLGGGHLTLSAASGFKAGLQFFFLFMAALVAYGSSQVRD